MWFYCIKMIVQHTKSAELFSPVQHLDFHLLKITNRKKAVSNGCCIQIYGNIAVRLKIVVFLFVKIIFEQVVKIFVQIEIIIVVEFILTTFFIF